MNLNQYSVLDQNFLKVLIYLLKGLLSFWIIKYLSILITIIFLKSNTQ